MNLQELLQKVDDIYPNGETNAVKVGHMNTALDSLYPEFGKTKVVETLYTVQDQDEYTFPTGIQDISQILDLSIGNRPIPMNRHDYMQYSFGYEDDNPMGGRVFFQTYNDDGDKFLGLYPIPSQTGLPIRIKYHHSFARLDASDLTQVPELREEYQMLLVFYAIHAIADSGSSADSVQADAYMQKYDYLLMSMWHDKMTREANFPTDRKDNLTWRRYR